MAAALARLSTGQKPTPQRSDSGGDGALVLAGPLPGRGSDPGSGESAELLATGTPPDSGHREY